MAAKGGEKGAVQVASLPKMAVGRPLLLGRVLDACIQDYINALRKVGEVVNTTIAMAAANNIIVVRNPALLVQHLGHVEITKVWVKSLFQRMGYAKNALMLAKSQLHDLKSFKRNSWQTSRQKC